MTNCILSGKPRTGRHGLRAALIGLVALLCFLLIPVPADADEARTFNAMLALANKGDAEAQYHVGMMYNNGIGTQRDLRQAFEWFQKSAAANDPLGAYKLGCYYDGQGEGVVATDTNEALKYKLIAAKAGYALAQHDVALLYDKQENFEEAMKWWKLSGDQGHPRALYNLSGLYFQGKGAPKDLSLAYAYYKLSKLVPPEKVKAMAGILSKPELAKAEKTGFRLEAATNSSHAQGKERCQRSRRTLKNHQELAHVPAKRPPFADENMHHSTTLEHVPIPTERDVL